jgi:hypothetical protein
VIPYEGVALYYLVKKCFLNKISNFRFTPDIKSTHSLSKVDNQLRSNLGEHCL